MHYIFLFRKLIACIHATRYSNANLTQLRHVINYLCCCTLRVSLSIYRTVHYWFIRRLFTTNTYAYMFNGFNWNAFKRSIAPESRPKSLFYYNHERTLHERSLIESLSHDACRSIRTCQLCGSRGHCLRMEVTCNSRSIYRFLISRSEINRWIRVACTRVTC